MSDKRHKTIQQRLWDKADRAPGGCLLFVRGQIAEDGYAHCWHEGKAWAAHRVAWTVTNGPIHPGVLVLHRCDVRNCIEPDHLFLGDYQANSDDMITKGRARWKRGQEHGMAVVTDQQAMEIKLLNGPSKAIARVMGLKIGTIDAIRRGQNFGHIRA
jgi:hypothetical protein